MQSSGWLCFSCVACCSAAHTPLLLLTDVLQKKGDYVFEGDDDYFDDGEDEDEEGRRGRGELLGWMARC